MAMTTEDMNYRHAVAKYRKRKEEEHVRQERYEAQSREAVATTVVLTSDDSDEDSTLNQLQPSSSAHPTPQSARGLQPITTPKRQLCQSTTPLAKRCVIDNPVFNAALDRTQTTTHQAMMIVTPALAAAKVDVSQL